MLKSWRPSRRACRPAWRTGSKKRQQQQGHKARSKLAPCAKTGKRAERGQAQRKKKRKRSKFRNASCVHQGASCFSDPCHVVGALKPISQASQPLSLWLHSAGLFFPFFRPGFPHLPSLRRPNQPSYSYKSSSRVCCRHENALLLWVVWRDGGGEKGGSQPRLRRPFPRPLPHLSF